MSSVYGLKREATSLNKSEYGDPSQREEKFSIERPQIISIMYMALCVRQQLKQEKWDFSFLPSKLL
jgi:hypothetical protein